LGTIRRKLILVRSAFLPHDFNTVLNSNAVLSIYRRESTVPRTQIESFSSNMGCGPGSEPW
jgi:hypothetical protein